MLCLSFRFFHYFFYTVVLYFDPAQRCCPQSSFLSFLFPFDGRSICCYSFGSSENVCSDRKKKFAFFSISNAKLLSFCSKKRSRKWLCLKIISFSWSDMLAYIFFVLIVDVKTMWNELSTNIILIKTTLCTKLCEYKCRSCLFRVFFLI